MRGNFEKGFQLEQAGFRNEKLIEAKKQKHLERQSLTEQLNQEIAEIGNSTKQVDFLEGANDITMESQSFTLPSKTADWFDLDKIAEIEK